MPVLPLGLISYAHAALLGLLQGVTELFPISSLGHSVILPQLLGWDIHQNDSFFITFLVATHLATALVLLGFFRHDWARIVHGLGRSLRRREIDADSDARLGWLPVVGTIGRPARPVARARSARPVRVGALGPFFLILNGLAFGAERIGAGRPPSRRATGTCASPGR